ncbi:winged helix-turn-helix transcriptional regulator [Actinoplanes sp. RD1]|uniref:winged helix-turn-helix transcriptional regulator n=1 Tax=Actinoplanes sp. RD1 TaxID=3064538 RepID=UPI00274096D8|nr:helix-turn-helix domain-containing protein [Actinoplanes sp. RD1]
MSKTSHATSGCAIARGLGVLGERWTGMIVRDALRGVDRFADFAAELGIAQDVLTKRLNTLVAAGVMEQIPYQDEGSRTRHRYVLTASGRQLAVALAAVGDWAATHHPVDGGSTSHFVETSSGQHVRAALVTDDGRIVAPADARLVVGDSDAV